MKIVNNIEQWIGKYWVVSVVGIAALFFWLTMLLSIGQPIWFDEGYSILLAKSSWGELLSLTAVDAHPPLYYLLLKLWGGVFGFSEVALRAFGALLMSLAVAMVLVLIKRMFSLRVALMAALFFVFAPFLLRYGYEVRMYGLATLIAVSATYSLVRAQADKGWKWWMLYALFVALGMYTLYLMVAVWLAHFVWLLVTSIKSGVRPFWRWKWLYAFGGAVILFAPYIPTFIHQLTNSALPGMGSQMTVPQLTNIASTLTLYTPEWSIGGWGTIVIVTMAVVLTVVGIGVYRALKKEEKGYFLLFIALSAVPVVFYALTSLPPRDPIFIVRYMAHSALFIYGLIGVIVALYITQRGRHTSGATRKGLVSAGVLTVMIFGTVNLYNAGNFNFERMQQPLTHLVREASLCHEGATTIIADDPYTFIDSAFYFQDCDLRFYSKEDVAYKGGYAMLHGSDKRVASAEDVTAPFLVHLSWTGGSPQFTPGSKYHLVDSRTFDKQVVSRYQLIEE